MIADERMAHSYWAEKGPLQAEYTRLYEALVPDSGSCATLEGEFLRAVSKINHDYFNNGFGNDWSGAYVFLAEVGGPLFARRMIDIVPELAVVRPYRNGVVVEEGDFTEGRLVPALDGLVTKVVSYIIEKENSGLTPTELDMWDFHEEPPSRRWDDEEDYA